MAGRLGPPEQIAASVWRRPYSARERIILSIQAKNDRRSIPPLWLWRIKQIEEPGGTDLNPEVYWESTRTDREYHEPIPAHIYIDWTPRSKGSKKGVTETTLVADVAISRAEARRLGALFETYDDGEHLISEKSEPDYLFLPRPGDILRFDDDFFEILQWNPPEYYGPTSLSVVWKGKANMFRDDSVDPLEQRLPPPPSPIPPRPVAPRAAWRG